MRFNADNVVAAEWISPDALYVRRSNGEAWLSADGRALASPTQESDGRPNQPDAPAPDHQYTIAIDHDQVRLYATDRPDALGAATLTLQFGTADIRWSPDSRRAVLVADEGLYWWDVAEAVPVRLEADLAFQLAWSPTGERLAYLAPDGTVKIVAAPDAIVASPAIELGFYNDSPRWISPDLIEVYTTGAWASETYYIQARTGRLLPSWFNAFSLSQSPTFSPDRTWTVLDHSLRLWRSEVYASEQYFAHRYELVNTVTGASQTLLDTTESQYLDWVGWSADGSRLWLISRPTSSARLPDARMPFGLLRLDPETGTVETVIEQAVYARLTPDGTRAWVVFPARHAGVETLGLDGALVDLAMGELTGRSLVANTLGYPISSDSGLYPSAWSADGQWLAFADNQGRVGLVNGLTGAMTPVAADLPLPGDVTVVRDFRWSSDRVHVLFRNGRDAWIVDVSAITGSSSVTP